MKKGLRGIVVVVVLLCLAIAYALFNQTINATGTAKVKGSFQITPSCSVGIGEEIEDYITSATAAEGGYNYDSCTVILPDDVSYNAILEYPGALRYFTVKMENTGTINAKINSATGVSIDNYRTCVDADGSGQIDDATECAEYPDYMLNMEDTVLYDGEHYYAANNIPASMTNASGDLYLSPGQSIYFIFSAKWKYSGEGDPLMKQNTSFYFKFEQNT